MHSVVKLGKRTTSVQVSIFPTQPASFLQETVCLIQPMLKIVIERYHILIVNSPIATFLALNKLSFLAGQIISQIR